MDLLFWFVCLHIERVTGELCDDNIQGNAGKSCEALLVLGNPALPYLESMTRFEDEQPKSYVKLVIWNIKSPPKNSRDIREREELSKKHGL